MITRADEKAFSMIELMIVVAIMAILALLAAPRIKSLQARANQAEGKLMLNQIYMLEESIWFKTKAYAVYDTGTNFVGAPKIYGAHPSSSTLSYCEPANLDSDVIATNSALGFEIKPCDSRHPRYGYEIIQGGALQGGFWARARSGTVAANKINPGCSTADEQRIDTTRVWIQTQDSSSAPGC